MKNYRLQLLFMNTVIKLLLLIAENTCKQNQEFDDALTRTEGFLDLLEEEVDSVLGKAN